MVAMALKEHVATDLSGDAIKEISGVLRPIKSSP
jgi:hypothetical protein